MNMLDRLLATLKKADLVSIDDQPVTSIWTLHERTGQPDNQVLYFAWTDGVTIGKDILTEGGITAGQFLDDGKFVAPNYEGDPTVIRFYSLQPRSAASFLSQSDLEGLGYVFTPAADGHTWTVAIGGVIIICARPDNAIADAGDNARMRFDLHQCDNCGLIMAEEALLPVRHLGQRTSPGGTIPSGECSCGALCYSYS